MHKTPKSDDLTVLEAVDNLSSMAELDIDEVSEHEVHLVSSKRWLNLKDERKTEASINQTFRVIHKYLKHIGEKESEQLQDHETQKGIEAIMSLAKEAAANLDNFNAIFRENTSDHSVSESKDFKDLEEYYMNKLIKRFEAHIQGEDAWLEAWDQEKIDLLDVPKVGFKDLETVRKDRDYELFYIRKEDGRPFFNRNLLRHIRLVLDFDEIVTASYGEDPLLHVSVIQDYEACFAAREIKNATVALSKVFLTGFKKFRKEPLAILLNNALTALMLAANEENRIEHGRHKGAIDYFHDFQLYLRLALTSEDYENLVDNPPSDDKNFGHTVMKLIHALCYYFFTHDHDRSHSLKFIKSLIHTEKKSKSLSIWTQILDEHERVYEMLTHFPNGPLFKTLDFFMEEDATLDFDPLIQNNFPSTLFKIQYEKMSTKFIKTPSPVHQSVIDKAVPSEEFVGLLRYLSEQKKPSKVLLFNYQDRTNWREFARATAIENLSTRAEFSSLLYVATIPKSTEFYMQQAEYIKETDAKTFLSNLHDQALGSVSTGHFFSPSIDKKNTHGFIHKVIPFIHEYIFGKKKTLTRKNRLDFIEIFHLLMHLNLILVIQPAIVGFTCKDWVDIGPASTCGFYALIRLLNSDKAWTDKEFETLFETLMSPALILRERVIDSARLNRFISALSHLSHAIGKNRAKVLKEAEKLYGIDLKKLKIVPM